MKLNISKVLVANRGEIAIRVFRACRELGIRTVAIYSEQDRTALFRDKADESYLIGKGKTPVEAYLDMDAIISLAKKKNVDAIHPGYGFLSENPEFAKKVEEQGLIWIGPSSEMMKRVGDKIQSKLIAKEAGVPTIPGVEQAIKSDREALDFANRAGYPIILKASAGGGGRGMRVVRNDSELLLNFHEARSEAGKAFGIDDIFVEKYLENPKHIEVQILGDNYGNIVHLFERDCSIQRRNQKLIEFAPSLVLSEEKREEICKDAVKIAKYVGYRNAGTVEFLLDDNFNHYFIEMNTRIQVEHTITELITGYDLVESQILIADGFPLNSKEVGIPSQNSIKCRGYAIQCRVTTEDPSNRFAPDYGKIDIYRTDSGFGIRLDGGNGFTGSMITPYYDSLLVKISAHSRTFEDTVRKALRSLGETKVAGVKTNIPFLINVLKCEDFVKGICKTSFIGEHPELFEMREQGDTELGVLKFIGEKTVNFSKGNKKDFEVISPLTVSLPKNLKGTKKIFDARGTDGLIDWIKEQKKLLITDTSFRDAHQSLLATRVRTRDMLNCAEAVALYEKDLFSIEMWGGATYDVAYRFLNESPWKRLKLLRKLIPNILFQMLFRGSNGVGYSNLADNVIRKFINLSSEAGIDVFRIFDSLNWVESLKVPIEEVKKCGKVAEAAICYTGDILDKSRTRYTLEYYVKMARVLESEGADILAIKDMSGLLRPMAAYELVKALKENIKIPIHLHTHDSTGNGVATVLKASEAGVDIADCAISSLSGLTSQPSLNSVAAALEHTPRETGLSLKDLEKLSEYWNNLRPVYEHFESGLKAPSAEIYRYEIPGGQYSNLKPQVESFGLSDKFEEVKEMYRSVNIMLGDIIKVTPSSKMVGDLAIFMVKNSLTPENILEKGKDLSYPDSCVSYFKGMMGQPDCGFPEELQSIVLKGEKAITVRPGKILKDEDFSSAKLELEKKFGIKPSEEQVISSVMYPKVYDDYRKTVLEYGELSNIPSDVFFHGMKEGETREVEIHSGRILVITLNEIGKIEKDGKRRLDFEINGNHRSIKIQDKDAKQLSMEFDTTRYANANDKNEISSPIPGSVIKINKKEGENVEEGESLIVIEAMKMETNITAKFNAKVKKLFVKEGDVIKSGELLMILGE